MNTKSLLSQTKKHILETAQGLFVKYNYASVSMNDIAKELKLSKPALYHHFKNKEELYLTILRYTHEQHIAQTKKIVNDSTLDIKEKFQKIILAFLNQHNKYCRKRNVSSSLVLMQKLSKYHKSITDFMKKSKEEVMDTVEPLIKEIIKKNDLPKSMDPKLLFLLISGAMNAHIINHNFLQNKDWTSEKVAEHLTILVFKQNK